MNKKYIVEKVKLINNIGVYYGIGLDTIEFTTDDNDLILLEGSNGSGKSSTLEAISFLPRKTRATPTPMIKKKDGTTEIQIYNGEDRLILKYDYIPFKDTHKLKLYVIKIHDNGERETLTGGNTTEYYDLIKEWTNICFNNASLIHISDKSKNIIDLTSVERKEFLFNNISGMERFTTAYEISSDKCKNFKRLISSIKTKLTRYSSSEEIADNIKNSETQLESIDGNIAKVQAEMETAKIRKEDDNLDPYKLKKSIDKLELEKDDIASMQVDPMFSGETSIDSLIKYYDKAIHSISDDIHNLDMSKVKDVTELTGVLKKISEHNKIIEEDEDHLDELITEKEDIIKKMELLTNISVPEAPLNSILELATFPETFIRLTEMFNNIEDVEVMKREFNSDVMPLVVKNTGIHDRMVMIDDEIKSKVTLAKESDKLKDRPSSCKDDSCPFIKDLLRYKTFYDDVAKLSDEYDKLQVMYDTNSEDIERMTLHKNLKPYYERLQYIIKNDTLKVFGEQYKILVDIDSYLNPHRKITFSLDNLQVSYNKIKDNAMMYDSKERMEARLREISKTIESAERLGSMVAVAKAEIGELNKRKDILHTNIDEKDANISSLKTNLRTTKKKFDKVNNFISHPYKDKSCDEILNVIEPEIDKQLIRLTEYLELSQQFETKMSEYRDVYDMLSTKRDDVRKEHSDLVFQLRTFQELNTELKLLTRLSSVGELIRAATSPKSGAPLNNINLLCKKLKTNTNILLEKADSKYRIHDYVLTPNEFNIEILLETGEINKNISNLSGGELSLISLAQSISLVQTLLPNVGFVKLDELDSTLADGNKRAFMKMIEMSGLQVFMISHNNAIEYTDLNVLHIEFNKETKTLTSKCNK